MNHSKAEIATKLFLAFPTLHLFISSMLHKSNRALKFQVDAHYKQNPKNPNRERERECV